MSVTEDFHTDPRPLVAGDITGVRSFAVDKLGRLTGVSHAKVWRPGVNTAECPHARVAVKAADAAKAEREGDDDGPDMEAFRRSVHRSLMNSYWLAGGILRHDPSPVRSDEHRPGSTGCQCGFWAYFDGSDDFSGDDRVTGVVRGSGVVTVGTKGFRAERAEVVALVAPDHDEPEPETDGGSWWDRLGDHLADPDNTAARFVHEYVAPLLALLGGALALGALAAELPLWLSWLALGLAMLGATLIVGGRFARERGERRRHTMTIRIAAFGEREPLPRDRWEAVRRNYPDVPVYPSLSAALRDHPLTPPPAPEPLTPQNTPDFWEREA